MNAKRTRTDEQGRASANQLDRRHTLVTTGLVGAGLPTLAIWLETLKRGQAHAYRIDHGEPIAIDWR